MLLDAMSNELQYVKNIQQVVNNYYKKHPIEAMRRLEQQTSEIIDIMYDSVTNQNFDRVSDDVDRVSGAVDNNSDKIDTDNIQMPYDNDNNTTTGNTKYEQNMTDEWNDTDTNDTVPHDTDDNMMTKVKWSIETNDTDNRFLRDYDNVHKSMEDREITDSHDYLDLASTNIIQYRTRGQKQRQEANEMAYANRRSAHIEYIKPNTKFKT